LGAACRRRRLLLAVRDLASGYQLAWLAVPDEAAVTAAAALAALFREHGPPLVLKSDNGSAFRAEALGALLAAGASGICSPRRACPALTAPAKRASAR
jgi:transposase InsO family protein